MIRNAGVSGECVTDEALTDYLDGSLDPIVKTASEVHLLACDRCRTRLAFFMRLLKENIDPQEQATLDTVRNQWEKTQNERPLRPQRGGLYRHWMLTLGSIVALLVLAVGMRDMFIHIGEPNSAGEVVQLLLDQHRPFEARMSSQAAIPYVVTRGTEDSDTSYGLLSGQMVRLAATPSEMGRFYLLQHNFNRAIEYLQPAAQESGSTAELHNDLGVAYLESGGAGSLEMSVLQFNDALAIRADFAPAIFNLALAYERMGSKPQESATLSHFLQVEKDKTWLGEARAKLEGIKAE